jgi:hypothetical protein
VGVLGGGLIAGLVAALALSTASAGALALRPESDPQTTWVACNANATNGGASTFKPLSDAAAAALVTPEPEVRPYNDLPYVLNRHVYRSTNSFVPSAAAITAFRASKTSAGQTEVQFNPYTEYVDGLDGIKGASTDDLIQWAAHKWGIPEDWLRAQYVEESYWNSFTLGDDTSVSPSSVPEYPSQARINSTNVYQSMGIAQVRWAPDGSVDAGTEPLRWESTAFNIDYQAAMVRFYYDNPDGARSIWGDSTYQPCQQWNSIGGWNSPYPWENAEQESYISAVQQWLSQEAWTTTSFLDWTPSSFPPGIKFF